MYIIFFEDTFDKFFYLNDGNSITEGVGRYFYYFSNNLEIAIDNFEE